MLTVATFDSIAICCKGIESGSTLRSAFAETDTAYDR